nr:MmgE/PrpD family protein [Shimia sp. R10_1]
MLSGLEELSRKPIDQSLELSLRLRLLDTLGCVFAGAKILRERDDRIQKLLESYGSDGPASVIGFSRKSNVLAAALVNGISSHMAEMDDGHRKGIVHAGAVIVPALISVIQDPRMTDRGFLVGLLVGYEAAIRIACTLQPHAKNMGWHGTGVFGCVGAALGVASALGADKEQMRAALSAGATSASGLLQVIRGTSDLKPFNSGQASQAGVSAALIALAGFSGAEDVLSGHQGLAELWSGKSDYSFSMLAVTPPYCVNTVYVKPYASCRYAHAPVEAILELGQKHDICIEEIETIEIDTFKWAIFRHDHSEVTGISDAKMSVPFCVSSTLVTGQTGMEAFTLNRLSDSKIQKLAKKVVMREDPEMSARVPNERPAKVTIKMRTGRSFSARVDLPRGEPETCLSCDEQVEKFIELAVYSGLSISAAKSFATDLLAPSAPIKSLLLRL